MKKLTVEKLEKQKHIVDLIGGIGFLSIPTGFITWLFYVHGWKIAVVGVIVFLTMLFFHVAIEAEIRNKMGKQDDQ